MPDPNVIGPNAVIVPGSVKSRGYRFLSVDFSTRRITHEFRLSDVEYSFQRNQAGEFSASIDLYSPQTEFLKAQETFLVVERRGKPFWCGFLWQPTRSDKTLDVSAQEVWSLFGHRKIRQTKDYMNQDRGFILRDLVLYAQEGPAGDLYVSTGSELVGGSPTTYRSPWWENKSVAEVVDTITSMDPSFTFRIEGFWEPGNKLAFRLVIDTAHPVLTKHRLIYGANVDDYEWSPLSPSPNFIDGFGGFDNEAMLRRSAQNDAAMLKQPRIESSIENRDLLGEEGVAKLATNQLKRMSGSPSQPTVTMRGDADPELGTLMPGYSAWVTIRDGYVTVDDTFSVEKISVAIPDGAADQPGAETVKLEFESKLEDASVTES